MLTKYITQTNTHDLHKSARVEGKDLTSTERHLCLVNSIRLTFFFFFFAKETVLSIHLHLDGQATSDIHQLAQHYAFMLSHSFRWSSSRY